jgi:hypothetical protein
MRRGLRFLIDPDPEPADRRRVWAHFQSRCAYCDRSLADSEGDLDHLVSAAQRGGNSLANRVLSCKPCNAEEKRDQEWSKFLTSKCKDQYTLTARRARIQQWIELNGGHPVVDEDTLELLNAEAKRVTDEYDAACRRIREHLRAKNRAPAA